MKFLLTISISCCLIMSGGSLARARKKQGPAPEKLVCFALPKNKQSKRAAALLNQRLRESCKQASKTIYVNPRDKFLAGEPDIRLRKLARAQQYASAGQDHVDMMEMEAGLAKYVKARELFREAAGRLGDGNEYIQTLFQFGAAHILSGHSDLGQAFFQEAAGFNPKIKPDPKRFTPAMLEVFERACVFAKGQPLCSGLIKSVPSAAEVYLNADFQGITPITLKNVPEGDQFLRVEKDGYMHWGRIIQFWATNEELFNAEMAKTASLPGLIKRQKNIFEDMDDDPPPFPIVKLAEWFEAKRMVLMQVEQEGNDIRLRYLLIQTGPREKLHFSDKSFKLNPDRLLTLNSLAFRETLDKYLKDMRKKVLQ